MCYCVSYTALSGGSTKLPEGHTQKSKIICYNYLGTDHHLLYRKQWRATMQEAYLTLGGSARRSSSNEYVQLKRLVKQRGLLDLQPAYYTWKFLFTLGLLVIGLAFLFIVHNFWLQLLNALYVGFVSMQFGLLGHDIGHRQVFRTGRRSRIAGFLVLSILFLCRKKAKYIRTEALLLTLHYGLYVCFLLWRLNFWQVLPFIIVHHAFFGLYLGSIGAPNHKGMPIMDEDSPADFLRQQVLAARNVKGLPLVDFWYGGLNYQIEHHLFPTMPRNKLRQARPLVKAFCEEHAIAYCETSMLQSYQDILRFLHQVSAPLREEKA